MEWDWGGGERGVMAKGIGLCWLFIGPLSALIVGGEGFSAVEDELGFEEVGGGSFAADA